MYGAWRRGEGRRGSGEPRPDAVLPERRADQNKAGARIRSIRRARGLTQDQLAQATGVSRSAVAQWETGRAGFGAKVRAIATALDVSLRELQQGAGDGVGLRRDPADMNGEETSLLRHFRELSRDDQACILRLARRLASVIDD